MQIRRLKSQKELRVLEELSAKISKDILKKSTLNKGSVKKMIKEIEEGNLLALGAYEGMLLIGCVIIKFGTSNAITLQNFLIAKDIQPAKVNAIWELILPHVEVFCQNNGFETCNVEILTHDPQEITFFLSKGFAVVNFMPVKDKRKPSIYYLTRNVSVVYRHDPLDVIRMTYWTLSNHYMFAEISKYETSYQVAGTNLVLHKFNFEVPSSNVKPEYTIKGQALVEGVRESEFSEAEMEAINRIYSPQVDLKLLFSLQSSKRAFHKYQIRSFGLNEIKGILGQESSANKIPFSMSDVGGLVVFLDENLEKIFGKARKQTDPFILYLVEGYGNALMKGHYIFFCKHNMSDNEVSLYGIYQIKDIYRGQYGDVEKKFRSGANGKGFEGKDYYNEEDWATYTSFIQGAADNELTSEIQVLLLSPVKVVDQSLHMNPLHFLSPTINKYIHDEMKELIMETCYIDVISADRIQNALEALEGTSDNGKNEGKDDNGEKPKPKSIFISYSKNERKFKDEFVRHFDSLIGRNEVVLWHDGLLEPGCKWDSTIRKKLAEADIVLCLLSREFLANKYIWEVELQEARKKKGNNCIIPIFISSCNFDSTFFKDLNGLLTRKHIPHHSPIGNQYGNDGIIWIGMELHEPNRDYYYLLILGQIKQLLGLGI